MDADRSAKWCLKQSGVAPPATTCFAVRRGDNAASSPFPSAGWDDTVRIWNAVTGEELNCLNGYTEGVLAVAFTGDGRGARVASGSNDRTIRLWDPDAGREVECLEGHRGQETTVAFAPDSAIISGSEDGTVRWWPVWSPAPGSVLYRYRHRGVRWIGFSPDWKQVLCGFADGRASMWDVDSLELLEATDGTAGVAVSSVDGAAQELCRPARLLATGNGGHVFSWLRGRRLVRSGSDG